MTSSLSKVIKTSLLLDTLNDTEFHQVLANFVKQCGRSALLAAFFDQFMTKTKRINHTANSQHIDKMFNITNSIARKRDKNSNPNESNKSNISTVPTAIIGEVASYLPQTDYASFSVTNRSIYLGCNDPKTLKHVDLLKFQQNEDMYGNWTIDKRDTLYDSIDLSQYPQLTSLEVDLSMFCIRNNSLSSSAQKTVLPHLYKLTLDGDMSSNGWVYLNAFSSQTVFDLNKITHLKCYRFGHERYNYNNNNNPSFPSFESDSNYFSKDSFLKLLSHFPNVEHLNIDRVVLEIDGPTEINLPSILPKLEAIRCISTNLHLQNHMLTSYGASLKCVTFQDSLDVKIKSMPNLEEFLIYSPTVNHIRQYLIQQSLCQESQ